MRAYWVRKQKVQQFFGCCVWIVVCGVSVAQGGVFNTYHFVTQGQFAVGLEPEMYFQGGAHYGMNARYTHGLSDLSNFSVLLGAGDDYRGLRLGSTYTFDFFPDVGNQPGIGLALQGIYVRTFGSGALELSAIPYVHKHFTSEGVQFEPFVAIPFGTTLSNGTYVGTLTLAMGSMFVLSPHFNAVGELGVGLSNTDTYLAGGIAYYY
jgi:hypothetical protein